MKLDNNPHITTTDPSFTNSLGDDTDRPGAYEVPLPPYENVVQELEFEYPTIYKEFVKIQKEQLELFAKKHLDYGMSNITAGTTLSTPQEVNFSLTGIWYRISDKIQRWKNLLVKNKSTTAYNESLEDTFKDIGNYAIISQIVSRGKWVK